METIDQKIRATAFKAGEVMTNNNNIEEQQAPGEEFGSGKCSLAFRHVITSARLLKSSQESKQHLILLTSKHFGLARAIWNPRFTLFVGF